VQCVPHSTSECADTSQSTVLDGDLKTVAAVVTRDTSRGTRKRMSVLWSNELGTEMALSVLQLKSCHCVGLRVRSPKVSGVMEYLFLNVVTRLRAFVCSGTHGTHASQSYAE
jgi:hypothetical protein